MNDLYEFLAFELGSAIDTFSNEQKYIHEICSLLAVEPTPMPETFYRLYTDPILHRFENPGNMINAVAFFSGAGMMNVECDCDEEDKGICDIYNIHHSNHFLFGVESAKIKSSEFHDAIEKIMSLRKALAS